MKKYYVYELIDPRNNIPFYVGKGTSKRMYYHFNRIKKNNIIHNKDLQRKLKELIKENLEPIYKKILETNSPEKAYNKEIKLIKEIGRNNLCNWTDGGEGCYGRKLSEETKLKIKLARTGKKHSQKTIKKIKEGQLNRWKNMSESEKDILKNKIKNSLSQPKIRNKILKRLRNSPPMLGKKHSQETKHKIHESLMRIYNE